MTMQTTYFKEHAGSAHNPTGQLSSAAAVPWWSGLGSQSVYDESFAQLKSLSMEHPGKGDQLTAIKQVELGAEDGTDKGNSTQFTIFSGMSSLMLFDAILEDCFFVGFVMHCYLGL